MRKPLPISKDFLEREIRSRRPEDIAKDFGCHPQTIKNYLIKFNIYWSRNDIIHDFFDTWSSDMAYILGFITADGNVHKKRDYLYIEVSRKDECVLEYILSKVYPSGKIYHYEHRDKRTQKIYYSSKIAIYSRQIKNSLANYSIFPDKTGKHSIDFNIPEEFVGDYIRGFFDGDGSIYKSKNQNYLTSFGCQSLKFLEDIRILTNLEGAINKNMRPPQLTFGLYESLSLRDMIYKNDGFSLERKKTKFFDMSVKYRVWTPELHSRFLDMVELKYKNIEIAKELNLTKQQIINHKGDYKRNAI